jgi:hypothetical protein
MTIEQRSLFVSMGIPKYVKATPAKHVNTEVQLQLAEARSRCRPATHHRFSFLPSTLLSNTSGKHETSDLEVVQYQLFSVQSARVKYLRPTATGSVLYDMTLQAPGRSRRPCFLNGRDNCYRQLIHTAAS